MNTFRSTGWTAIVAALCLAATAEAQTIRTWGDGIAGSLLSGTHSWETGVNWTGDDDPDSPTERAVVGDATGDRLITTPGPLTIHSFHWSQSTDLAAGSANRISLGGDLSTTSTGFINNNSTGADPSRMVLDLNGHTIDFSTINLGFGEATFMSTGGGGRVVVRSGTIQNVKIEGDITVAVEVTGNHGLTGSIDPNSTWELAPNGTHTIFVASSTTGLGNLVIGRSDGATAPEVIWDVAAVAGITKQIQSNVTIHPNADFAFGTTSGVTRNLMVAGDWTDTNTTGGYATKGRIIFNGGTALTPSTIDIRRTDLVNDFRVGNVLSDGIVDTSAGHVQLAHDLATTGSMTIRGHSSMDLVSNVLTVGSFTADSGATLAYSFGAGGDGLIDVNGLLTLPSLLIVDVTALGGPLANGRTLFTFADYVGPSDLSSWTLLGDVPDGFTAQFLGNSIVLAIPEPASLASLIVCGAMAWSLKRPGRTT